MDTKGKLPYELEALDRAYTHIAGAPDAYRARQIFNDRLPETTKRLQENTDPVVVEAMVKHWTNHFSHTFQKKGASDIYTPDLDLFIGYVARHKIANELFSDPSRANLLACLCLVRVHCRDCGNVHPKQHNVEEIFEQWAGVKVPSVALRDISHAIAFLFGDACLALYRNDVEFEAQLPKYLWSLGLPLQHRSNTGMLQESARSDLPYDLS